MKRSTTSLKVALVVVSFLLFIGSLPSQSGAAPLKIRIGYVSVPSELMAVIFTNRKVLKHFGKSYTAEFIGFRGTGPMIQALAAKEIDLATLAFNSFASAINNAKLDLKIYADNFQDGAPGYYTGQWAVLADSGLNSIEDLRGKRFAVPALNTGTDLGLRAAMLKHGMAANKDYSLVEVRFPNM